MINYSLILCTNYAGKAWSVGETYESLQWFDKTPKPTQAELDALWQLTQDKAQKDACKEKAKQLLAQSDWSVLPDVGLANSADYVTYRGILRGLVTQPQETPDFPVEPKAVWE